MRVTSERFLTFFSLKEYLFLFFIFRVVNWSVALTSYAKVLDNLIQRRPSHFYQQQQQQEVDKMN
jgi:hypothetical protein